MVSNTAVDFVTSTTGGSLNKTDSISDIGLKNSQTPKVTSGLAVRIRDVQVGGEVGIDVEKRVVEKYALGVFLSRSREKMGLVIGTGFNTVTGTYLQKFSDQLEVACRTTWNAKLPTIGVEVGAKWWLLPPTSGYGRNSFIKTKIDSVGRLGISLSSDVRPGMQVIMGAIVETGKLGRQSNGVNVISEDASGSASHKLGIQILYTI